MSRRAITHLACVFGILLFPIQLHAATEFPIAVGADSTISMWSPAFDGWNYLVGIQGDAGGRFRIAAQLVSPIGTPIGDRISVGRLGDWASGAAGPLVAFDGLNYLLVWTDRTGADNDVYGQFVAPSGALVGAAFPIAATGDAEYCGTVAFGRETYLVLWAKHQALYGQRLDRSGNLLGGALPLTSNVAFNDVLIRAVAVAFDGTNFFAAWQDAGAAGTGPFDIHGCFVSEAGVAGAPFVISGTPSPRFNYVSIAWNGTNLLVAWNRDIGPGSPSPSEWDVYGRLVSPAGMMGSEFAIASSLAGELMPSAASSGDDYLVTWSDGATITMLGRTFNSGAVPVGVPFTVFEASPGTFPLGGVAYGRHQFLAVATRGFGSNGDVYGTILRPSILEVEGDGAARPGIHLSPIRPNPSARGTDIRFELPEPSVISLGIFDVAGREVASLIADRVLPAGEHVERWDAGLAPAGVYFVRLRAAGQSSSRRIILLE